MLPHKVWRGQVLPGRKGAKGVRSSPDSARLSSSERVLPVGVLLVEDLVAQEAQADLVVQVAQEVRGVDVPVRAAAVAGLAVEQRELLVEEDQKVSHVSRSGRSAKSLRCGRRQA